MVVASFMILGHQMERRIAVTLDLKELWAKVRKQKAGAASHGILL